ncbi:hypothetical protein ACFSSA_12325, partial [Luteolibacter algae]
GKNRSKPGQFSYFITSRYSNAAGNKLPAADSSINSLFIAVGENYPLDTIYSEGDVSGSP